MPEKISAESRSALMAKVRSRGNLSTELRLAGLFRKFRIHGWRRGHPLIGRPDFVFRSQRIAVFVDGCFWHGCPTCYRRPHANRSYWDEKVKRNRMRDQHVNRTLKQKGWRVVRLWEHQLSASDANWWIGRLHRLVKAPDRSAIKG